MKTSRGDVRLVATISTFATALDVTVAELKLEAFLPADRATADILARSQVGQSNPKPAKVFSAQPNGRVH